MYGPQLKKNACVRIDASQSASEVFQILGELLETIHGDLLHHKNRTKTGIQKAIDRAFYRFIESDKGESASDLKASGICSKSISRGLIYQINGKTFFTASFSGITENPNINII